MNIHSGDRTPKQKVKLKVTEENILNLMLKYNGGNTKSEVILIFTGPFIVPHISQLTKFVADEAQKCCSVARSLRRHSASSSTVQVLI